MRLALDSPFPMEIVTQMRDLARPVKRLPRHAWLMGLAGWLGMLSRCGGLRSNLYTGSTHRLARGVFDCGCSSGGSYKHTRGRSKVGLEWVRALHAVPLPLAAAK